MCALEFLGVQIFGQKIYKELFPNNTGNFPDCVGSFIFIQAGKPLEVAITVLI